MCDAGDAAAWNARAAATRDAIRDMNAHDIVALRRQCLDTIAQLLAGPCAALAARYSAHRAAPAAAEPGDSSWLGANDRAGWCSAWLAEADAAGATRKRALDEWLRAFCEFAWHVYARTHFMPTSDADAYYVDDPRDVFLARRPNTRRPSRWSFAMFNTESSLTCYDSGAANGDSRDDAELDLLDRVFICMRCSAAVVDVGEDFFGSPDCILELLLLGGHNLDHVFFYSDHFAPYVRDFAPVTVYSDSTQGAMMDAVRAVAGSVANGVKQLKLWGEFNPDHFESDRYTLRNGGEAALHRVLGADVSTLLAHFSDPCKTKDVDKNLRHLVKTVSLRRLECMFAATHLTRHWPALLAALFPPP